MRTMAAFLIAGLMVLASSLSPGCRPKADKAELAAIDSLIHRVDSMQAVWKGVDIARYEGYAEVFSGQKKALETLFVDTLDRDRAFLLGNYYRAMGRTLQKLLGNHGRTGTELTVAAQQLADLRHDVERGLLNETERMTFLQQERLMVESLTRYMHVVRSAEERISFVWNEDHATVDSIINTATQP